MNIKVKRKHIREGIVGDCHRCAVSLALEEVLDDSSPCVVSIGYDLYVEAWGRVTLAPYDVVEFVHNFDDAARTKTGRITPKAAAALEPFTFELPPLEEWQEQCHVCENVFDQSELDAEGYCNQCLDEKIEEVP